MNRGIFGFLILIILQQFNVSAQVNLSAGLVAHYPLDGNGNDVSGNNHHGVLVNGTTFSGNRMGVANTAGLFDGSDDYIRVRDNGAFSTPTHSLVIWFQTETNNLQNLVGKRDFTTTAGSGGAQYQFFINYPPFPGIGSNLVGNNSSCNSTSSSSYINTNDWICINRWYMAVITYDGSLHKIYIDGVLKRTSNAGFPSLLTGCNSDLRFGNWWAGDLLPFKGKMDDIRWYNRAINQAEVNALYDNSHQPLVDFEYKQLLCSPQTVEFTNRSGVNGNVSWTFGDGRLTTTVNPSHNYTNYGTYTVKMVSTFTNTCKDSVTKTIPINRPVDGNVIAAMDTSICLGQVVLLSTVSNSLSNCWSPAGDLNSSTSLNPLATPAVSTTYSVNSLVQGNNLVANGGFDNGAVGFTSDYSLASSNTADGQFTVANTATPWNTNFQLCTGHNGAGNMLIVNGNSVAGAKVWTQTIAVSANTNYAFSTWIQSLSATNPANLIFSVNGIRFGNSIIGAGSTCQWNRFYATWNSGSATTAVISIINQNTTPTGNDFALDEISFAEALLQRDSIRVNVSSAKINAGPDTSICPGISIQLNALGGSSYTWQPSATLSSTSISNPIAFPLSTTEYIVESSDVGGCLGRDTIKIAVLPTPVISLTNDTLICTGTQLQLLAGGGATYQWLPSETLSALNIPNPTAKPIGTTKYTVEVTGQNGCKKQDSVMVVVATRPILTVGKDTSICSGSSIQLFASSDVPATYTWHPASSLNNSTVSNPVAIPLNNTSYSVIASSAAGCESYDTITVGLVSGPAIQKSSDTTVCTNSSVPIFASGGIAYRWEPAAGLSNPLISNPIAQPVSNTVYKVFVTGNNGCTSTDSVSIKVRSKSTFTIQPSSPSVCSGDSILLSATGGNTYEWIPANLARSPSSSSTLVSPTATTLIRVRISDRTCNITDTLSTLITVNPIPKVSISSSNDLSCSSPQTQLNASGALRYTWSPTSGLSDPNIANPVASPQSTTTYLLTATSGLGCKSYNSISIKVDPTIGTGLLLLPTAFTPNNDGKNDCFGLKSWGTVTDLKLTIFNRWGQKVFETSNSSDCWDGNFRGVQQQSGAFVYMVTGTTLCSGKIFRKGTIVLLR
ncbi:T9SS type B sorting domain-containing protein [Segetibacter sp. 3557_3]|uniref:T9SS type B sorting domain-containing protein n=1 Tax=Segetibacter sp. 3557_3 TaxID=2547429 RepID=UPI0010587DFD|nr:gliding motility-associated C-terminal domain-containing protein [Segetibacter sp. 3557_3]TDH26431.1 T9SS type B sorting domain-containing protein [Segetibacter sp. 3557_3]